MSKPGDRVLVYDTTLRDGTQGEGVSLSLSDKLMIAARLDEMGIDYIEGGYPLSNPKDVAFFEEVRKQPFKHAKFAAFGMTRRRGVRAEDDTGMRALLAAETPVITIVAKAWDLHVTEVLGVTLEENLAMIADSVRICAEAGREVVYDAEHFFDGQAANPEYALKTLLTAQEAGANWVVLCDTNGGSLPEQIAQRMELIKPHLSIPIGIHTHNDGGLAVANSLKAVLHGATQVQGTINGIGERCGNADLTTVVADLGLKMGYAVLADGALSRLAELSRYVYEMANLVPPTGQPFVGHSAFAHKGGMHVHAVRKATKSYEHVDPQSVGNVRRVLVSELSGASNIAEKIGKKFGIEQDRETLRKILERVQDLENEGYVFESAEASLELICREQLGQRRQFWEVEHWRTVVMNIHGQIQTTEAIIKLQVNGDVEHHVGEGDGPVDALSKAFWKALKRHYPAVSRMRLVDYKVRVVNPKAATEARVRVIIEFRDEDTHELFSTVGVSENIIDASWEALVAGAEYKLLGDIDRAKPGCAEG